MARFLPWYALFAAYALCCTPVYGELSDAEDARLQAEAERVVNLPFNKDKVISTTRDLRSLEPEILKVDKLLLGVGGKAVSVMNESLDLDAALRGLGAEKSNLGTVITLSSSVLFAFDKHDLRPEAEETLQKILSVVNQLPAQQEIAIEGHTDSLGTEQYNLALSQRRAGSVSRWLVDHNVDKSRLQVSGLGESKPVATNETAAGRQNNRRVTITFLE